MHGDICSAGADTNRPVDVGVVHLDAPVGILYPRKEIDDEWNTLESALTNRACSSR